MQQYTGSGLSPMMIARRYSELKADLGTAEAVAAAVGCSPSKVSRYLALLDLPQAAQDAVEAGELPVAGAGRAWRKRKTQPSALVLPKAPADLYTLIGEKYFITIAQAAAFLGVSIDSVRRAKDILEARGLVELHKEIRPYVFRLSSSGAARLGKSYQRRWVSASAMHQYLLRNQVEIDFRRSSEFGFIERVELYRLGFNPGVAEHCLVTGSGDDKAVSLIIIDDYEMPLKRVSHRLARFHNPQPRYYSGEPRQWLSLVQRVLIFTTSDYRVALHRSALRWEVKNLDSAARISPNDSDSVKTTKRQMLKDKDQISDLLSSARVAHIPPLFSVN